MEKMNAFDISDNSLVLLFVTEVKLPLNKAASSVGLSAMAGVEERPRDVENR